MMQWCISISHSISCFVFLLLHLSSLSLPSHHITSHHIILHSFPHFLNTLPSANHLKNTSKPFPPIHFPIPLSNPKTNTPTPSPATMKRRTGEVLAICEHSKVNIVGVELPGSKEKGREGKESKL